MAKCVAGPAHNLAASRQAVKHATKRKSTKKAASIVAGQNVAKIVAATAKSEASSFLKRFGESMGENRDLLGKGRRLYEKEVLIGLLVEDVTLRDASISGADTEKACLSNLKTFSSVQANAALASLDAARMTFFQAAAFGFLKALLKADNILEK